MQNDWFKDWFNSAFYHKLYAHRDEAEAAEFIDNLVTHLKPISHAKMLDVACGKGRHSLQLASKGYDVTGIDLSKESINEALKSEAENVHFFVHDMRHPFWINYFDIAFNFFTSFGYFDTQREHDNAIKSIVSSLNPNGIFVMDFLNVQYSSSTSIADSQIVIDSTTYTITKWSDEKHFYKKIIVQDAALPIAMEYIEKVAKFSLEDFTVMFNKQNLKIKEVFGDYSFNKFDKLTSPRLIIVAQKGIHFMK